MNPELLNRIQAGTFAQITLDAETVVSGYIGTDPDEPGFLRLDLLLQNPDGYLEEITLRLLPDDIVSVRFLYDPPEFSDRDGNVIALKPGFFKQTG